MCKNKYRQKKQYLPFLNFSFLSARSPSLPALANVSR